MSLSSNEKFSSLSQDEEDSGRSSVDEPHTALDDRERINHLETAVAWIRGEVVSEQCLHINSLAEIVESLPKSASA